MRRKVCKRENKRTFLMLNQHKIKPEKRAYKAKRKNEKATLFGCLSLIVY